MLDRDHHLMEEYFHLSKREDNFLDYLSVEIFYIITQTQLLTHYTLVLFVEIEGPSNVVSVIQKINRIQIFSLLKQEIVHSVSSNKIIRIHQDLNLKSKLLEDENSSLILEVHSNFYIKNSEKDEYSIFFDTIEENIKNMFVSLYIMFS